MAIRVTTLAALAIMPLFSGPAQSQAIYNGPWCAIVMIGEGSIAQRCDMRSYEMCQQEIRGQGASHCVQNPRYRGPVELRKKQRLH
jgi:hypothetical protein